MRPVQMHQPGRAALLLALQGRAICRETPWLPCILFGLVLQIESRGEVSIYKNLLYCYKRTRHYNRHYNKTTTTKVKFIHQTRPPSSHHTFHRGEEKTNLALASLSLLLLQDLSSSGEKEDIDVLKTYAN